ncbi:MAG: CinA family nicotinamide mononucleotide deamidase-related protein [Candidatus Binatia bacterium]
MKAEIISVGTELLLGHTDTNSSYLAKELASYGIDLHWISQVGDNLGRIVDAFERAASRSELIITSGGLGPTEDDLTREAIASWVGEKLEVDSEIGERLRQSYLARGRPAPMPESRLKMALKIPSATLLRNENGAAPGLLVREKGVFLVALPGIPVELMGIWETEAVPRLHQAGLFRHVIFSRTLKTVGIGESDVEERIRDLIHFINPTLATYATRAGVQIRITAKAQDKSVAESLIEPLAQKVAARITEHLYGVDDETLAQAIGQKLIDQSITLAIAETGFTGGTLIADFTGENRSKRYFKGGVVLAGSRNPLEMEIEQTDSADGTLEMARRAREKFSSDVALALTGSLDPKSSVPERITELGFGISGPKGERRGRARIRLTTLMDTRRRAVLDGMGELWRYLSAL